MVLFPNAKINIGLNIIRKRTDGYHDIETLFYPLSLSDILEIVPSDTFGFVQTGITIDGDIRNNLVVKAYELMKLHYNLPGVKIHLHKVIPFGAGLGGGSSDAAFTILGLNSIFSLGLSEKTMVDLAARLGSDCPFFILNRPVIAEGRGEIFTETEFSLKGYHLVLIKPDIHVPTALAYSKVRPSEPEMPLISLLNAEPQSWKDKVINDFEMSVFTEFPAIANIKAQLYQMGAVYASMSGSGSSVFGIFSEKPLLDSVFSKDYFVWTEELV